MITTYSTICNMYYQGTVRHDNMANIKTKNYIIDLIREEATSGLLPLQYEYRCIIIFKDLLGREVKRLVINESQARVFIDSAQTFIFDEYTEMYCLTNITGDTIFETYGVKLSIYSEENKEFLFQIMSMTPGQPIYPLIGILLDLDELDNLIDAMFFIFLIDLASERRSIFKV